MLDTTCAPTSCNDHGTCDDSSGTVTCTCEEGYAGAFCDACADGIFPDGAGGCDADLCDPSPCDADPDRGRCEVQDGMAVCRCNAGTHEEDGACVRDETCTPDTCAGHGTCMESMGTVGCACDEGWAGTFCDACDEAAGYHADGTGGCTTDVCVPSPCTAPLRTVCSAGSEGAVVPGTYDILYRRGYDYSTSSGQEWVDPTDATDPFPNGWRVLRSGVVIAAGASTLSLDIPSSVVTGPITLDGSSPPAALPPGYYESVTLYAVSRDTGMRHILGYLRYNYVSGSPGYRLDARDGTLDARLVPGIYDVLYRRGYDYSTSSGQEWVDLTDAADPFPNGWRYLDRCVAFP
ncbi:MAG: calcium-binding EGF-like domain-containing protein [Sandaracinaceae bacterium]|nr:calcium-binding EGF-like domain-containing protein [Sandaracinaceae bacterium]